MAIITPATKLAIVDRAAKPTASPSTAEDANTACAYSRVAGMLNRSAPTARNSTIAEATRRRSR